MLFFLKKELFMGEKARKCVGLCKNADECVRDAKALRNAIIDFR